MDVNPYQAPDVEAPPPKLPSGALRREGNLLVTPTASTLPPRCVKCNQPMAGVHLKRNLSWHHPVYFAFVLLGALPYVLIALVARRQAVVHVGLSRRHRSVRRRDLAIAWVLALLAIVGFFFSFSLMDSPRPAFGSLMLVGSGLLMIVACVWGISRTSVVRPKRIDRQSAWIRGVCPEFLAQVEQDSLLQ